MLRLILKLDAVVTGANGAAYLIAAGPLEDLLGVSANLSRPIGAFLLAFAAAVWLIATRPTIERGAVQLIVAANLAWAFGSLVFAALDVSSPSTVGSVWIVLQALSVGGFAALQAAALRGALPASANSSAISS